MEKLDLIINEIICKPSAVIAEIGFLDKYFALLAKYDYINTINFNDNKYNGFWNDFFLEYQLSRTCLYLHNTFISNELSTFQKIVSSIINIDTDNIMKIIPLLAKFDLNGILTKYLLEINFFDELESKLFKLIKCIRFSLSVKSDMSSLNHEHVLFNDYKKTQHRDTINFVKINEFMESMDRGGRLNFSTSLLNLLCPVLYKLNKTTFMDLFNNKDSDFMHYLTLIYPLDISQQIDIALCSNNVLVKFAVIWHVNNYANYMKELYLYPNEVMKLAKVIVSFSTDSHVWDEFINYVFSKITMNDNLHNLVCAFGLACNELEKDVVRSIFDKLPISKYIGFENIINNVTHFVTSIIDSEKQHLVYELLYNRWECFVDNYPENLNNLLLTNLVNVVINGVVKMQQSSKIQNYINVIISLIDSVDNIWFNSITEQRSFIYKQLSKLFVYCLALKSIDQSVDLAKLRKVVNDIKFLKREVKQEKTKTTLMMFNEYLFE